MNRRTLMPTQMGGEGLNWTGIAPFTAMPHVFQNLGDGTYFHSGLLAVRGAVQAGVNITYKVLYNDAVAMTGGQPVEGHLSPVEICRQLLAERVRRVAIVSDDPDKFRAAGAGVPADVTIHHRDELDAVQMRDARDAGRHRDHLRADLRRREAPPPQARRISRPAEARRSSTRPCAKAAATARHRRTACRSCRRRPSSAASARSTSRTATRTTAASRASALRSSPCTAASCASRRRRRVDLYAVRGTACRAASAPGRAGLERADRRHRRHGRRDRRLRARDGGAPRRQARERHRHDRPRAEERRRLEPPAHRR